MDFAYSRPAEIERFTHRFAPVLDAVEQSVRLAHDFLNESLKILDGEASTVMWMLGAACLREFDEVWFLCGNGFGTGGNKLLRALYERTVTLAYLAKTPEKLQQFIDYSDIHWHKLLVEADTVGTQLSLSPEERRTVEANYARSKDNYEEEVCAKCHKSRLQQSWTKAGIPQLATKVDAELRSMCASAYLAPTFHIHTTHWGILNQCDLQGNGALQFLSPRIQHKTADDSFAMASYLVFQVAVAIHYFFKLSHRDKILEVDALLANGWKMVDEFRPRGSPESQPHSE
jgi:cytochrome c553